MQTINYHFLFKWLLRIFILHTTCVAIGLFVIPSDYLAYFDLEGYHGRFFQIQAGLFHLVMGVAYFLALRHGEKEPWLVFFAVIAKSMALVFLLLYYIFMERSWIIIFSAFGDGAMGLLLLFVFRRLRQDLVSRP